MNRWIVLLVALALCGCEQKPKIPATEQRPSPATEEQFEQAATPAPRVGRAAPIRQNEAVPVAAFSPDGKKAVSSAEERGALLWDLETGAKVRTFAQGLLISAVAYLPDGQLVLTGSADGTIALWRTNDGTKVFTCSGHRRGVLRLVVSKDGKLALSAGGDHVVKAWILPEGKELRTLANNEQAGEMAGVALSPDGRRAALAGTWEDGVRVVDVETGQETARLPGPAFSLAFSSTGRFLVAGGIGGLKLWELATNKEAGALKEVWHPGPEMEKTEFARAVAFLPGDKQVFFLGQGRPKLWDIVAGNVVRTWTTEVALARALPSPDGKRALFGSSGLLQLWDLTTDREVQTLIPAFLPIPEGQPTTEVMFSPDGTLGLWGQRDGTVAVWDMKRNQIVRTLKGNVQWIERIVISSDNRITLAATSDHLVHAWDTASGKLLFTFDRGGSPGTYRCCLAVSPDGSQALTGDYGDPDEGLVIWDLKTGKRSRTIDHNKAGLVLFAAFLTDGKRALSVNHFDVVNLWDLETGALVRSWRDAGQCCVACSPAGNLVLRCGKKWQLWDLKTGEIVRESPSLGLGGCTALSADGRYALGKTGEGSLWLVDTATGKPLARTRPRQRTADGEWSVAFSPDGKLVRFDHTWQRLEFHDRMLHLQPFDSDRK